MQCKFKIFFSKQAMFVMPLYQTFSFFIKTVLTWLKLKLKTSLSSFRFIHILIVLGKERVFLNKWSAGLKKKKHFGDMLSNCFFTLKNQYKKCFASFCWETCLFVKLCDKLDFKRKSRSLQEIIFFFLVLATFLWNTLYIIKNKKLTEQIKTYVTTSK